MKRLGDPRGSTSGTLATSVALALALLGGGCRMLVGDAGFGLARDGGSNDLGADDGSPETSDGSDGATDAGPDGDGGPTSEPVTQIAGSLNHPWLIASDEQRVYWTEYGEDFTPNGSVQSCPVTGCDGSTRIVYASQIVNPTGIAVDAQNVYWTTSGLQTAKTRGAIWTCPIAGCPSDGPLKIADADSPYDVAVDSMYVYWDGYMDGTAHRALKTGGPDILLYDGVATADTPAPSYPQYCAVDRYFYMSDALGDVFQIPLTGGAATLVVPGQAPDLNGTWPLIIANGQVYFGEPLTIFTMDEGTKPNITPVAMYELTTPDAIALDPAGSTLYFADWATGKSDGRIGKVSVDQFGDPTFLVENTWVPGAIAVSGDYVFWLKYGELDDQGNQIPNSGAVLRAAK